MKLHSPAAARNRLPIAEVLGPLLTPGAGGGPCDVLEIASGSGEHAIFFCSQFPEVVWQPSDGAPDALASIDAHRREVDLPNLRAPRHLEVMDAEWAEGLEADAVVCINMVHIAPWEACVGLLAGSARILAPGRPLFMYGPYRFDGAFTAPSNKSFDASLRARNPRWGVRDVIDITREAALQGLASEAVVALPANNHALVFRRR